MSRNRCECPRTIWSRRAEFHLGKRPVFPGSSAVEPPAVNRAVASSNLALGANLTLRCLRVCRNPADSRRGGRSFGLQCPYTYGRQSIDVVWSAARHRCFDSSAGRAPRSHRGGRRFEPCSKHQWVRTRKWGCSSVGRAPRSQCGGRGLIPFNSTMFFRSLYGSGVR